MAKKATGGQVSYYLAQVRRPRRSTQPPYQAECEDIIKALGMTFDEGCAFKALWRTAAARLGDPKPGKDPLEQATYDAEKIAHYGNQMLLDYRYEQANAQLTDQGQLFEYDPKKHGPVVPLGSTTASAKPQYVWHNYDGTGLGGRSIKPETLVYIRTRDNAELGPRRSDRFEWRWSATENEVGDIIAYRFA